LARTGSRRSVLPASVHSDNGDGVEAEKMSNKKFSIDLTYAEFYALRNSLRKTGDEPELLAKIEAQIEMLQAYFDGRWHLPRSVRPYLGFWEMR
jgi:hypothetical protein